MEKQLMLKRISDVKRMTQKQRDQYNHLLSEIDAVLSHHSYFRNCYFWNVHWYPGKSKDRYENDHTREFQFTYGDVTYRYECFVFAHSTYVEYHSSFTVDGVYKDVRAFKKIRKQIQEELDQRTPQKERFPEIEAEI